MLYPTKYLIMIDVCGLAALQLKERLLTFPWKIHGKNFD